MRTLHGSQDRRMGTPGDGQTRPTSSHEPFLSGWPRGLRYDTMAMLSRRLGPVELEDGLFLQETSETKAKRVGYGASVCSPGRRLGDLSVTCEICCKRAIARRDGTERREPCLALCLVSAGVVKCWDGREGGEEGGVGEPPSWHATRQAETWHEDGLKFREALG